MTETLIERSEVKQKPAFIFSIEFAKCYAITMRPYLLFVSGITGIAGLALAPEAPLLNLFGLCAVYFFSYGFGQALTDCFQTDTDSISSPYRPLVQGKIAKRDVLAVSLAGLALSGAAVVLANPLNIPLAALAVIGLASYTWFKRRWWAGPFYNAWIVAALCAIGYLSAQGSQISPLLIAALLAVFFGYANFVLTGYYKDVSADRATGYETLPVKFGLRASAFVSDIFAILKLGAAGYALYLCADSLNEFALMFASVGTIATVYAQYKLHRVRSESGAHEAISPDVHSYVLILSSIACAMKPEWSLPLVAFYLAFMLTMRLRPMQEQI